MLKINHERKVWWPVTVRVPVDGGQTEDYEVSVQYILPRRSEFDALRNQDEHAAENFLIDHISDWDGLADADGETLKFSPETLKAVLDIRYIERAFSLGLWEAGSGSEAKNSKRGSAG